MPAPDSGAPVAADPDVADGKAAHVAALQDLYRAFQKTTIYPPEHPAIPEALNAALGGFETALSHCDPLVIGVTPQSLLIDGESLGEPTGALQALAVLLHDLDLGRVEFHGGISLQELESFIASVGAARRDGHKGSALIDALERADVLNLRAQPIDYDSLSFVEGTRDARSDADDEDLWETLSASLADPSPDGADPTPEDAARVVAQQIERNEGTGIRELRENIDRMSREINVAAPDKRNLARERMSKFVTALSRKLRWDLLRIDLDRPAESVARVTELADLMPETDLLDALQEIDRAGARVPGELMTLMNKLVRLSRTRPTLASGLQDTLKKWGMPDAMLHADSAEFREALGELFQRRGKLQYNPTPYQGLLDNLSRSSVEGERIRSLKRYRNPEDREDSRLHMAQIAIRLLTKPDGEQYRAGLLAQVSTVTDLLLRHGRFDAVRDAAVAARAFSLVKTGPEVARQAARSYLEGFINESRIRLVLEAGFSGEAVSASAVSLLSLGGVTALDHGLNLLAAEPSPAVERALREFVKNSSTESLSRVVKWRCDRGLQAARPLVSILRELPASDVVPLVEPLLEHDDAEIRREAVLLIAKKHDDAKKRDRALRDKLRDPARQVVFAAIRALSSVDSPGTTETLACYIEGRLPGGQPATEFARHAVRGLAGKGESGITRLSSVLLRLGRSLRPRRLRLARRILNALESRRDLPVVAKCLEDWHRSPAARISRLMPWLTRAAGEDR